MSMEYHFSDLFTWTSGKPVTPTEGNIPIYGSNGIIGYSDKAKYHNRIILGRVGAYCGSVAYCPVGFDATDNTLITTCDTTKILYSYAYFLLKQFNLNGYAGGAAQPLITQGLLKHLKCNVPAIDQQQRIVDRLSTYDSLIEVNNKRIKVLEQIAENLYQEWFIRFRFPGHESSEFENGLPRGWKRGCISEFYITSSGGTPSREHDEYFDDGTIPWIKTGELQDCLLIDTEERITEVAVKKSSAKFFPKDSVLMAMYGVNIGMLAYSTIDATCNQACCVFRDKGSINTKHFLFQCLKSIRDYLLLISFGAAQQNLSQDLIKHIRIVMPDKETIIRFEQAVEPLYNETKLLLKANASLAKQRDLLLPRLMSGKLEV